MSITTLTVSFYKDGWGSVNVKLWFLVLYVRCEVLCRLVVAGIAESESEGTRAETRIGLSAKRTSPFKSAGGSVQSTTG